MNTYIIFSDKYSRQNLTVTELSSFSRKKLGDYLWKRIGRIVGVYANDSWEDAMQSYYDYMGYGKYIQHWKIEGK